MKLENINLDGLIEWMKQEASNRQSKLIVEARIEVSDRGAKLLAIQPSRKLEIIRY